MNKKGWVGGIIGFIVIMFLVVVLSLILTKIGEETSCGESCVCEKQCNLNNMTFYHYNYGGYDNAACLCKSGELIKTLYMS